MTAQPIRCDVPGHEHLADVGFYRTDGSVNVAFCDQGFLEFAYGLLTQAGIIQAPEAAPAQAADGGGPTRRRRGRSQPTSVPPPAVAVVEAPQAAQDAPGRPEPDGEAESPTPDPDGALAAPEDVDRANRAGGERLVMDDLLAAEPHAVEA